MITYRQLYLLTILNFLRIMRTIKIKSPFAIETGREQRKSILIMWANALLRNARLNIIKEEHYETGSYIVVENTRIEKDSNEC